MPKAREAAQRALELDENLAEAHTALGAVKIFYEWDWPGGGTRVQARDGAEPELCRRSQPVRVLLIGDGKR